MLARSLLIVLACAEGRDNKVVAAELGVHQVTVGKWRSRFIQRRLEGVAGSRCSRSSERLWIETLRPPTGTW